MRLIDSKSYLKGQLKNEELKRAYDGLEDEFTLAKEVIRLRIKAKMTQKELAEKAGTSQPAIARLESGRYHNVSLAFLKKIGKVLNAVPEIRFKSV
ncbi:MAG: helix-turn-helix transcriptional regulator [Acidobacteriota bacterium]